MCSSESSQTKRSAWNLQEDGTPTPIRAPQLPALFLGQQLKGLACLESCWGLQKCCRNQYLRYQAPHSESWRTQVYYAGGPRELTLQALSPEQRGYSFYTWTGMINWVCGGWAIAKSRTRVSEVSSSS